MGDTETEKDAEHTISHTSPTNPQHTYPYAFQTPTPARHAPNTRFHPYTSPGEFGRSPLTSISSPGLSPYPPLSEKQLKRLKYETKKTGSQVELFSDLCAHLYGERPDHDILVAGLRVVLDAKPEVRTFSALTSEDYLLLNPGESGSILYNQEQLHNKVSDSDVPTEFWPSLQTLRHTFSRQMELGVNQIIGHFLGYAVRIAQTRFEDSRRLVVHSEVDLPEVHIPEIGRVKGPLDYLTCCASGALSMSKCNQKHRNLTYLETLMNEMDGADVKPSKPFFICVEAKRWQAFGIDASRAQLLAQIRSLQISKSLTWQTRSNQ